MKRSRPNNNNINNTIRLMAVAPPTKVLQCLAILVTLLILSNNGSSPHSFSCWALSLRESPKSRHNHPTKVDGATTDNDPKDFPIHTLILCRHGDSIWNGGEPGCRETFTGWSDVPLSQKGIREAKNTGEQLKQTFMGNVNSNSHLNNNNDWSIDVCCTSLLKRAQMTTHYCLWEGLLALDNNIINHKQQLSPQPPPLYVTDYRLNERHYGSLQGFVKEEVEKGRTGPEGVECTPALVRDWRRSWHAVPPLLDEDDPRRIQEVTQFQHACGGPDQVPRGESLAMVAQQRMQPFLDERLTPLLRQISLDKQQKQSSSSSKQPKGGTALIVAHANSLRALIGTLCRVDEDDTNGGSTKTAALAKLEALKIPTGVPLALHFQETRVPGKYQVCRDPDPFYTYITDDSDEDDTAKIPEWTTGAADLPVWPLSSLSLGNNVGRNRRMRSLKETKLADKSSSRASDTPTETSATNKTSTPDTAYQSSSMVSLSSQAHAASESPFVEPFRLNRGPCIAVITETDACETDERVDETLAVLEKLILPSNRNNAERATVDIISVRVSSTSEYDRVVRLVSSLVKMTASDSGSTTRVVVSSDWVDAAVEGKAHGIHVKESHRPLIPNIRTLFEESQPSLTPLIGTSAHSVESAMDAVKSYQPDYLFVGTCYPTQTHPEKSADDLEGPELPGQVAHAIMNYEEDNSKSEITRKIPVFAIGGINAANCDEPIGMGASGVATIRAVLQAKEPVETVAAMRESMIRAIRSSKEGEATNNDDGAKDDPGISSALNFPLEESVSRSQ